jgi:hypothetical protein
MECGNRRSFKAGTQEHFYAQILSPGIPCNLSGSQESRKRIKSCKSFRLRSETHGLSEVNLGIGNLRIPDTS